MNVERFRVRPGDRSALTRHRPDDTPGIDDKDAARERLLKNVEKIADCQDLLYAQGEYALLNHDFLWRTVQALPARGRIGVLNRSYYEDVVVVRVHPALLAAQHLPAERVTPRIWTERCEDIQTFERHLWRSGTTVRKFFLHVSRSEQRKRLLARLDDPLKNWKFSAADVEERTRWTAYTDAYRQAIAATSSARAPWYVIPADHKWYAHVLISEIIVKALDELDLAAPQLSAPKKRELAEARRELIRQR